jgi:3-oxoacyl-[acyl-carrier protein] reductase
LPGGLKTAFMPPIDEPSQNPTRIAVVTGGSRGIGKAIVERLCRAGVDVCFTYLSNEEAANALVAALRSEGQSVSAERADSRDSAALRALVQGVIAKHGRLDALINNAGITATRLLLMISGPEWSDVLGTNLSGMFGAAQIAAGQMMRQRSGRIINLSSISGVVGFAGQTHYCATKSAILGFTRALSKELAPWGVSVNAVAPGYVETDMLSVLAPAKLEIAKDSVPMRRFGTPDEIANLVAYLTLEAPTYLTGATLVIDGGLTA